MTAGENFKGNLTGGKNTRANSDRGKSGGCSDTTRVCTLREISYTTSSSAVAEKPRCRVSHIWVDGG